ncbi:MAG: NAD(P)-dependent oxidoreductase [Alphaproteobacteria bacterium]|jgi:citronellol/citronellal dehydrogenase|nr:NAD(P)-dependent oxidoreductase [Alphaproteobacteria bacterium]
MSLAGKTLFITGASRGIGLAIAMRAARDGANIAIAAKTAEPHKHLPGTIYTAAAAIEKAGGQALPLIVDVRDEASVAAAVEKTVEAFGGVDICVNNASAISLTGTLSTDMKRYDLMHQINTRGTFLTSKACLPHLRRASNPHVLMLSPPLDMSPKWFGGHVAYTMAKFGMSMCVLGMAEEFKGDGVAFNALWPRTAVATAAMEFALGGSESLKMCRSTDIMADAAHAIFCKPSRECTGNFFIDDTLLYAEGVRDFDQYRVDPTQSLAPDFFVPDTMPPPPGVQFGPVG